MAADGIRASPTGNVSSTGREHDEQLHSDLASAHAVLRVDWGIRESLLCALPL